MSLLRAFLRIALGQEIVVDLGGGSIVPATNKTGRFERGRGVVVGKEGGFELTSEQFEGEDSGLEVLDQGADQLGQMLVAFGDGGVDGGVDILLDQLYRLAQVRWDIPAQNRLHVHLELRYPLFHQLHLRLEID